MRHALSVRIGPVGFRIGSEWPQPIAALRALYEGYPGVPGGVPDFTVRLEAERPWRRLIRPSVAIRGDHMLPDALPLPLKHGLLAAEMGMNLQLALGARRWLLLHAASVERDGRALLMTGDSGSGKSTMAAILATRGWRLMGDEFALIDLDSGRARAFPRAVSLKNGAIEVVAQTVPPERFGPRLEGTPKGVVQHLRPTAADVARMDETAAPALILFPRFGFAPAMRGVGEAEVFVRLTQASTNYVALRRAAFDALTRLVTETPAAAIDYPDTEAGIEAVEELWREAT